jgi:hypothetical protein
VPYPAAAVRCPVCPALTVRVRCPPCPAIRCPVCPALLLLSSGAGVRCVLFHCPLSGVPYPAAAVRCPVCPALSVRVRCPPCPAIRCPVCPALLLLSSGAGVRCVLFHCTLSGVPYPAAPVRCPVCPALSVRVRYPPCPAVRCPVCPTLCPAVRRALLSAVSCPACPALLSAVRCPLPVFLSGFVSPAVSRFLLILVSHPGSFWECDCYAHPLVTPILAVLCPRLDALRTFDLKFQPVLALFFSPRRVKPPSIGTPTSSSTSGSAQNTNGGAFKLAASSSAHQEEASSPIPKTLKALSKAAGVDNTMVRQTKSVTALILT